MEESYRIVVKTPSPCFLGMSLFIIEAEEWERIEAHHSGNQIHSFENEDGEVFEVDLTTLIEEAEVYYDLEQHFEVIETLADDRVLLELCRNVKGGWITYLRTDEVYKALQVAGWNPTFRCVGLAKFGIRAFRGVEVNIIAEFTEDERVCTRVSSSELGAQFYGECAGDVEAWLEENFKAGPSVEATEDEDFTSLLESRINISLE